MTKFINRLAAVAALALAATPIIGLTAAHAAEPPRIQVGDLKLANPGDAAEFVRRTRVAADEVCSARTATEKLRGLSVRACYQDFNADVRSELSREQLADLRAARRAKPAAFATRSLGLF